MIPKMPFLLYIPNICCTFAGAKVVITMEDNFAIQLFEGKKVRIVWDEEKEKYWFSVVDIIQVLTGSDNPQIYWRVLKKRLRDEGNETVTNCNALKLPFDEDKSE
jgi:prophage antirepressor-like protein